MEILPRERRIQALLDQRFDWTTRQREVLDLIARGKTNQEIAEQLGISLDGAKWHMREILSKLGVDTREEAAEYWRRRNGWRHRLQGFARLVVPAGAFRWGAAVVSTAAAASGIAVIIAPVALSGDDRGNVFPSLADASPTPTPSTAASEALQSRLIAEAALSNSEHQRLAIVDGVVSKDEYRSAVLATAACMTAKGIEFVDPPHWDGEPHGRIRYSYISGPTIEIAQETSRLADECRAAFSEAVEQLWIIQQGVG